MTPSTSAIEAYFSDPINFPLAFKQWLIAYLEVNQPYLIASQLSQKGTSVAGRGDSGFIDMWGGTAAPTGTVLCDGASYLRADGVHDALFAAIGTSYGAADGTHFNVPDLRGRGPVAVGTHADVNAIGNSDGVAAASRRPKHKHVVVNPTITRTADVALSFTTGLTRTYTNGSDNPADILTPTGSGQDRHQAGDASVSVSTQPTFSSSGGTVGPQTGAEPIDTPAFLVVNFVIWL